MAAAVEVSTPMNQLSRDHLRVLIRNNIMNESLEFSDCDHSAMETDSPLAKPNLQMISKKLFHSPCPENSPKPKGDRIRRRKRKNTLIPSSVEKIKRACIKECESLPQDGVRRRVLVSLFSNKEYSMDFS